MKETFEPLEVGKDFPIEYNAKNQTKYLSNEKLDLLMNNVGTVFLIYKGEGLGNQAEVMSKGNSIRGAIKTIEKRFKKEYPNHKLSMAVRQTVKNGGVVKLYARIELKEE